ncbi:MAG: Ig-like domain repeat protein [Candidatus Korobacteraceae bacterium]
MSVVGCVALLLLASPVNAGAQTAHFSYAQVTLGSGFGGPQGVAVDRSGNVFVADTGNSAVKEILAVGGYTTVNTLGSGFYYPSGVAVDRSGNVFVADTYNSAVKEILAVGGYTTVNTLGSGFNYPFGVAVDGSGNAFVADTHNGAVKEIVAVGGSIPASTTINTLGSGFGEPYGVAVDGSGNVFVANATAVQEILAVGGSIPTSPTINTLGSGFLGLVGVAVDGSSNVFFGAYYDRTVGEILAAGGYTTVNTVANGLYPTGVAVDGRGNVFVADTYNNRVVEMETAGVNFGPVNVGSTSAVLPLTFTFDSLGSLGSAPSVLTGGAIGLDFADAGTGTCTTNGTSYAYNPGDTCTVDVTFSPQTAGTRDGTVVLTDGGGNAIATAYVYGIGSAPLLAFGPGIISTIAGKYIGPGVGGDGGDGGPATSAQLFSPSSVALDGAGNFYIADSTNNVVRKVTSGGVITTYAGRFALHGYSGDGGPATSALFANVNSVAVDGAGNLYIADSFNNVIRKVTPDGVISTVAGSYNLGSGYSGDAGPATSAQLNYPDSVALDEAGNLYIEDSSNFVIRKVTTRGTISTVAGNQSLGDGYSGDGGPATSAQIGDAYGIALDEAGNLYIVDTENSAVRMVTPAGIITTVAGNRSLGLGYSGDGGLATSAQLAHPTGAAVDAAGDLYIADADNGVIRKVAPDGIISTVVGNNPQGPGYSGDGGPATSAQLDWPADIVLDGGGNPYIADLSNNVIRKVDVTDAPSLTFAGTYPGGASAAQDIAVLNLGNEALMISRISTPANFSLGGADTSCSVSGQTLQPAASCVLGIEFTPAGAGTFVAGLQWTDNTLNYGEFIQGISLQGTAPPEPTTTTVTAPATAVFTSQITLTATVSGATSASINGNVTFSVGGSRLGTVPVTNGVATLIVGVDPVVGFTTGSDTITASYAGDASFVASSGSTTLVASLAPTTTTVPASTAAVPFGSTTNLSAWVSAPGSTTITGTITFMVGSTTVGTATAAGGLATLSNVAVTTANGFTVGSDTITANYSGDANFAASSGSATATVVMPTYTLTAATSLTATSGGSITSTFLVRSSNYSGTVTFATAITSANGTVSAVAVSASPVTLTPAAIGTSTLTITTTTSAAAHAPARGWKNGGVLLFCVVLFGAPFSRFRRKRIIAVLLTALAISLAGLLMSCGSSRAARVYTVTLTPTGTGTVTNPQPLAITVTVR